jgi:hypothetical protein
MEFVFLTCAAAPSGITHVVQAIEERDEIVIRTGIHFCRGDVECTSIRDSGALGRFLAASIEPSW